MAVPVALECCMLGLPLVVDIGHWFLFQYTLKNVLKSNTSDNINDQLINIVHFRNQITKLSDRTFSITIGMQALTLGVILINPYIMQDPMITALSIYGKFLATMSPMTPLMFTLATHEFLFKQIGSYVYIFIYTLGLIDNNIH